MVVISLQLLLQYISSLQCKVLIQCTSLFENFLEHKIGYRMS